MIIDVNAASQGDLVGLLGIGEQRAATIIEARPFNSMDGLLSISGIGPLTLERLKEQGLAVVSKPIEAKAMPGEEVAEAGEMQAMPGEELAGAGDMGAMPGEEVAEAGDIDAMPGEEIAGVGDMGAMPGEEMAGVGDMEAMPGEEIAGAGDMEAMPGEEMAETWEIQNIELSGTWRLTLALDSLQRTGRT